jgi:hypothetical protein
MYLDIQRKAGDTSAAAELVRAFCHRFRTTQWPVERPLPEVFYAGRSLSIDDKGAAQPPSTGGTSDSRVSLIDRGFSLVRAFNIAVRSHSLPVSDLRGFQRRPSRNLGSAACAPLQKGLFSDLPQRHRVMRLRTS